MASFIEKIRPWLESAFDSVVLYEGEQAAASLAEAVAGTRAMADVPNLVWFDGAAVRVNPAQPIEDLKALPPPSFDGLDLGAYLSPQLVLPLEASRGCYWGKCTFCSDPRDWLRFRSRPAEKLVEDVKWLRERYGARHIAFTDDAFPPNVLRQFAHHMAEERARGFDASWGTLMRFEKVWTAQDWALMAAGGCTRVMIGFESGSQRVIDLMKKGTDMEDAKRNLRDARVAVHLFAIVGFPGETRADIAITEAWIREMRECIASMQVFSFTPGWPSPVALRPQDFGVELTPFLSPDDDVPTVFDFVDKNQHLTKEEHQRIYLDLKAKVEALWANGEYVIAGLPRFLDGAPAMV
jgi:radical SAM superfamily enzyme YgiQ (UPF0313 family)